jgi:hypothetical protein
MMMMMMMMVMIILGPIAHVLELHRPSASLCCVGPYVTNPNPMGRGMGKPFSLVVEIGTLIYTIPILRKATRRKIEMYQETKTFTPGVNLNFSSIKTKAVTSFFFQNRDSLY